MMSQQLSLQASRDGLQQRVSSGVAVGSALAHSPTVQEQAAGKLKEGVPLVMMHKHFWCVGLCRR